MDKKSAYIPAFILSLLVHGTIALVLMITVRGSGIIQRPHPVAEKKAPEPEVVHAQSISQQALDAELKRLDQIDKRKAQAQLALQQQALAAKRAREREERKAAQIKKTRLAQEKQAKAQRLAAEKAEKARLEKEKAEKARLEKIAKARKVEEKKLQVLRAAREQEEQKIKAEKAKQKALQVAAERKKQAEREQKAREHEQFVNAQIAKYRLRIQKKLTQHWQVQGVTQKHLTCQVWVRLAPGGFVVNAKLVQKSGNMAYDRSCLAAIYKSEPFPVPQTAELFERFRELRFRLTPEEILSQG